MTIKLLADWPPYPINALLTLTAGEETALVNAKLATTTLTGGFVYTLPVPVRPDDPVNQLSLQQVARTQALVSGDVIANSRDGLGRVTSYTQGGTTYTVTYGPFGVATESGGGKTLTYNYSAAGLLLSTTLS